MNQLDNFKLWRMVIAKKALIGLVGCVRWIWLLYNRAHCTGSQFSIKSLQTMIKPFWDAIKPYLVSMWKLNELVNVACVDKGCLLVRVGSFSSSPSLFPMPAYDCSRSISIWRVYVCVCRGRYFISVHVTQPVRRIIRHQINKSSCDLKWICNFLFRSET